MGIEHAREKRGEANSKVKLQTGFDDVKSVIFFKIYSLEKVLICIHIINRRIVNARILLLDLLDNENTFVIFTRLIQAILVLLGFVRLDLQRRRVIDNDGRFCLTVGLLCLHEESTIQLILVEHTVSSLQNFTLGNAYSRQQLEIEIVKNSINFTVSSVSVCALQSSLTQALSV